MPFYTHLYTDGRITNQELGRTIHAYSNTKDAAAGSILVLSILITDKSSIEHITDVTCLPPQFQPPWAVISLFLVLMFALLVQDICLSRNGLWKFGKMTTIKGKKEKIMHMKMP